MDREPVPSAIVTRLLEAAKELEQWAVEHRQANLTQHEQGVLQIFRRAMGPVLGAVLERALQLDHPAARRQRAACPGCGKHRRPHQWRTRQPVSVCGSTPFQRPYYWCPACEQGWAPADNVLGLDLHQILSAELQAWVAETGAELPFQQAAERLERLAGIGARGRNGAYPQRAGRHHAGRASTGGGRHGGADSGGGRASGHSA